MVLSNGEGDVGQSTQLVTLYLTIAVSTNASPIVSNNPPEMPTKRDDSPAEEATNHSVVLDSDSGRPSQSTAREPFSPSSDTLPVETTPMPDGQVEMSPTDKAPIAVRRADEAKKPIDRVNTWKGAISRIKWVMDTIGPIAEVCAIFILPLFD